MKIIIIFLTILILSLPSYCQIQTNILGGILGSTSKQTMLQRLENKGYEYEIKTGTLPPAIFYNITGGVSFAGLIWDEVTIGFKEGKFFSLLVTGYFTEEQAQKLNTTLKDKYSNFTTSNSSPPYFFDYDDGKTNVSISIYGSKVTLRYGNNKLLNNISNSSAIEDL